MIETQNENWNAFLFVSLYDETIKTYIVNVHLRSILIIPGINLSVWVVGVGIERIKYEANTEHSFKICILMRRMKHGFEYVSLIVSIAIGT